MSDFEKKNLNCNDYESLTQDWASQLRQLGYQQGWGEEGWGWCAPDADGDYKSLYDAWREATGTPDDLHLGMTKEPPEPTYRKPV